jgi:excisionase family DNA binding protein
LRGSIVQVEDIARKLRKTIRKTYTRTATKGHGGDVLTPPKVAKVLGVDPSTVISWIQSRQLKASNVGKGGKKPRYRIQRSDLEAFMQSRQLPPAVATKQRRAKPSDDDIEYIR